MSRTVRATLQASGLALLLMIALGSGVVQAHGPLHEQIARLSAQIEKQPDDADLYLRRGELHRAHEDWKAAAADYERVAELDPTRTVVDRARGRAFLEAGRPRDARIVLQRYVKREPADGQGHLLLARSLSELGEYPRAARRFGTAIAHLETPRPEPYLERAVAFEHAGPRYREAALRSLDEGIARLGPLVVFQLRAIALERALGRPDAALRRLDTIASQSRRQEKWLIQRGDILRQAGRRDEARAAYRGALTSIERLRPSRRQTRATKRMENTARTALATLTDVVAGEAGPPPVPARRETGDSR